MNRRTLISTFGTFTISGCIDRVSNLFGTAEDFSSFEEDPIPASSCHIDNYHRLDLQFDEETIRYENTDNYLLKSPSNEIEIGSPAQFILYNITDRELYSGNRTKYSIQQYTNDGWREVRFILDGQHYRLTDEQLSNEPGVVFTWEFDVEPKGFMSDWERQNELVSCPELEPGNYRFVFFGLSRHNSVGTAFKIAN